jgi:hypothetical protein
VLADRSGSPINLRVAVAYVCDPKDTGERRRKLAGVSRRSWFASTLPPGAYHVAFSSGDHLRVSEIWDSPQQFDRSVRV